MVKDLLSDFTTITKPSYQSDSFQPYFSMILTVVTLTILLYSFQTVTATIHAYAENPVSLRQGVFPSKDCKKFTEVSAMYLCEKSKNNLNSPYNPETTISLEQDLHNPTN